MSTPNILDDLTEALRREQLQQVNVAGPPADGLTTDEAVELYEFVGFAAPYVVVRRRADGVKGTLTFTHSPRRYFDFTPTS